MTDPVAKSSKAHPPYYNRERKRIPSATGISGMLEKPGLVKWANNLGLQGVDSTEHVKNLARIGTLYHLMQSSYWKDEVPNLSEYSPQEIDRAENALISFWNWETAHIVKPDMVEKRLVSEDYQYGGQIDFYGEVDGIPTLLDLKTSKGIFPEHLTQIAAYHNLLIENGYPVKCARIVRTGRDEDEGFEDHIIDLENLDPYWREFLLLRMVYEIQKEIKKKGA